MHIETFALSMRVILFKSDTGTKYEIDEHRLMLFLMSKFKLLNQQTNLYLII